MEVNKTLFKIVNFIIILKCSDLFITNYLHFEPIVVYWRHMAT